MNDPVVYRKNNSMQRSDAIEVLNEYPFKWVSNTRIMDVGCGDGSTTSDILKSYAPENFAVIIGSDISHESIKFARNHYESKRVKFMELDIQKDIPFILKENFDHVFSFYALHWAQQQEAAFINIYNLLARGGNCLLVFLGRTSVYEVYDKLSRTQKWSHDLRHVRSRFISPYFDSKDPEGEILSMMIRIGFKDISVKVIPKTFIFANGEQELRRCEFLVKFFLSADFATGCLLSLLATLLICTDVSMNSLNPFDGLKEKWNEFMDDYCQLDPNAGSCRYQLIVVYGAK